MPATFIPVSWQRMSDAVEQVRQRLLRAAHALETAKVPYAVVGGNAVAAWVSTVDESAVRNTRDVDILLRLSDLEAATAALSAAGFVHRRLASLGQGGHMDIFLDGPTAKVRDAVHIIPAGEKTTRDSPEPSPDVNESEPAEGFTLVSLPALVRMKLTAWRDKDRMHLRDLASVGLLGQPAAYPELSAELQTRLQHILDTPEDY